MTQRTKRLVTRRPVHLRDPDFHGTALCGAGKKGNYRHVLRFPDSFVPRKADCVYCLRITRKRAVQDLALLSPTSYLALL